jgi:hypothetical protein
MLIQELILELRNVIGDNNLDEPNITDDELKTILRNAAAAYSRLKNVIKNVEISYDKTEDVYELPTDAYKTKKVVLKELGIFLNFTDNLTQIILETLPDADSGTLKITYSRYFSPEEVDERELDIYFICAEALCYKLMASKTADLIKFSTGEKIVDESLISEKYLKLYKETEKLFKSKVVKAYGKRYNNVLENLDYNLPYPPIGEQP